MSDGAGEVRNPGTAGDMAWGCGMLLGLFILIGIFVFVIDSLI